MYDLLKENMYDMYQDAGWGWNEAEKWREMKHRNARFLIAGCGSSNDVDERGSGKGKGAKADSGGDDGSSSEEKTSERRREGEGERGRLAGYCHFRFAWDEDENDDGEGEGGTEDVLYVYELQVASWAKRRGLGRRMMQALEVLAQFLLCFYRASTLETRTSDVCSVTISSFSPCPPDVRVLMERC